MSTQNSTSTYLRCEANHSCSRAVYCLPTWQKVFEERGAKSVRLTSPTSRHLVPRTLRIMSRPTEFPDELYKMTDLVGSGEEKGGPTS
jgi:hypothetical protein